MLCAFWEIGPVPISTLIDPNPHKKAIRLRGDYYVTAFDFVGETPKLTRPEPNAPVRCSWVMFEQGTLKRMNRFERSEVGKFVPSHGRYVSTENQSCILTVAASPYLPSFHDQGAVSGMVAVRGIGGLLHSIENRPLLLHPIKSLLE
jgi:hypothetical protein